MTVPTSPTVSQGFFCLFAPLLHEAFFPRGLCGKNALGALLRLRFFAFFAKNLKHNAGVGIACL